MFEAPNWTFWLRPCRGSGHILRGYSGHTPGDIARSDIYPETFKHMLVVSVSAWSQG